MKRFVVACGLAALMLSAPLAAAVKDGVDAWVAGDYPRAVTAWRGPAEAGDPDAQFNLGQAYKLGRGVPADQEQALNWYRRAASAGHEQAQATLGLQLFQSGKRDEALVWLKKAAEQGEPRAQYVVGTAYFNGDSSPKDWARAYALMTRAKAAGIGAASTSLAQMDQMIPDQQKIAGLAIARELERSEQLRASDSAGPDLPLTMRSSVAKGGPAPIAQTSVPASAPPPSPPAVKAAAAQPWKAPTKVPSKPAPAAPAPEQAMAEAAPPKPVTPKAPPPAPKPKPVVAAAAGGGWKIQLGAFASPDAAKAAWTTIAGKAGLKALSPSYIPVTNLTRLQAGPLASRDAANQACAAVKSAGGGCFPVAP